MSRYVLLAASLVATLLPMTSIASGQPLTKEECGQMAHTFSSLASAVAGAGQSFEGILWDPVIPRVSGQLRITSESSKQAQQEFILALQKYRTSLEDFVRQLQLCSQGLQTRREEAGEAQAAQKMFYDVVAKYRQQYQTAVTELQRTNLRFTRRDEMCAFPRSVQNWNGSVTSVRSDHDGNARLVVRLGPGLDFDSGSSAIRRDSPIHAVVLTLNPKDKIEFSGSFMPDGKRDCFMEASLTERGGMTEPEFLFQFTSIRKR